MSGAPPDGFDCVLQGRVEVFTRDAVALVRMNRPDKRNAIDRAQVTALETAFDFVTNAQDIRTIVLTGAGSSFCSGGDISMFQTIDADNALDFTRNGHAMLSRLEAGDKPVIAAVTGYCVAGGLELALACDFIIAGEGTKFGLAEVNLGLIPGWGGTVRIASAIPLRMARQILLTCELLHAQKAQALGLVNEVLADEAVLDRAIALAERIAAQPPTAVRAAKAVVQATCDGAGQPGSLQLEANWSAGLFCTSAVRERVLKWLGGGKGQGQAT